ncbi:DUF4352 domain-containing protein [uncultured Oscillibacter sp.]|jgi:hypothetical protein|uniref:DUF4352 domain-containing protein n=1 Tax=uncultured Oscillibacter sp. TaxID=876091 RepID=UPI00216EEC20|nr:DUF4352 domain-containing protein [uncultured Oscillibacter sp.]MCI9555289.1 DUF4352 domain-containing protein [Oscillibacter sp.]
MKKLLSLIVTLLLLLTLAACGGGSGGGSGGAGSGEVRAEDGFAEARIGDLVHSYFMDFTVNSAYTAPDYHGHTPPEGRKVLVVELTVKNTFHESIPMYDDDFQGQWSGSAGSDDFAWPITEGEDGSGLDTVAEEQLPAEYELAVNESRTGVLVFDVPAEEKDFCIAHMELFDNDSEGDTFFVYFTATEQ